MAGGFEPPYGGIKSGYSTNDFNAYSEKDRKFVPRRISSLAADSE
jgi:hypothetical protein